MSEGIKESKELIESIKLLAQFGYKVAEDKKIDLNDLQHAKDLFDNHKKILEGFKDLDKLDDEIKDLDLVEAQELLMDLFKAVKEVK